MALVIGNSTFGDVTQTLEALKPNMLRDNLTARAINATFSLLANAFTQEDNELRYAIMTTLQQCRTFIMHTATLDYIIPNFVKVLHSNDALARTLTLKSLLPLAAMAAQQSVLYDQHSQVFAALLLNQVQTSPARHICFFSLSCQPTRVSTTLDVSATLNHVVQSLLRERPTEDHPVVLNALVACVRAQPALADAALLGLLLPKTRLPQLCPLILDIFEAALCVQNETLYQLDSEALCGVLQPLQATLQARLQDPDTSVAVVLVSFNVLGRVAALRYTSPALESALQDWPALEQRQDMWGEYASRCLPDPTRSRPLADQVADFSALLRDLERGWLDELTWAAAAKPAILLMHLLQRALTVDVTLVSSVAVGLESLVAALRRVAVMCPSAVPDDVECALMDLVTACIDLIGQHDNARHLLPTRVASLLALAAANSEEATVAVQRLYQTVVAQNDGWLTYRLQRRLLMNGMMVVAESRPVSPVDNPEGDSMHPSKRAKIALTNTRQVLGQLHEAFLAMVDAMGEAEAAGGPFGAVEQHVTVLQTASNWHFQQQYLEFRRLLHDALSLALRQLRRGLTGRLSCLGHVHRVYHLVRALLEDHYAMDDASWTYLDTWRWVLAQLLDALQRRTEERPVAPELDLLRPRQLPSDESLGLLERAQQLMLAKAQSANVLGQAVFDLLARPFPVPRHFFRDSNLLMARLECSPQLRDGRPFTVALDSYCNVFVDGSLILPDATWFTHGKLAHAIRSHLC
ncbi:uncharacterized protein MONBRDRAFT_23819 [Monosiga brevicollis MX1]|uniref:Integrator complex subunit 7 N-terminal domain-containing protein n=1 Tax=Monosiga brevicollis TaxID=81824 RepID=A9UUX5_MONBE|nr:uncharacterized protein MONBRDRAFT_23819 [Monosiga brevicollis MX1]EDQ90795.1 predicted protein [Monosiga brevicollis MX1]|eukprot:XP_001744092.1 hypothetical protein [Monosiga brevicollis MX1]